MEEMQTFSEHMKSLGGHVDKRIESLVDILAVLPGVHINSCCGGHEGNSEQESSLPADEFFVDLSVEERKAGWASIERIVDAIWALGLQDEVQLTPWIDGGLRWDLRGIKNANPDDLAKAIFHNASIDDFEEEDEELCDDCKEELITKTIN